MTKSIQGQYDQNAWKVNNVSICSVKLMLNFKSPPPTPTPQKKHLKNKKKQI